MNKAARWKTSLALAAGAGILLVGADVVAAEGVSSGRKLWDNIMLFVNFGILVALFLRYARKPLVDFLRGERRKVAERLQAEEAKLAKLQSLVEDERRKLEAFDARIQEIQSNILEMGEREKAALIEQGRVAAEKMIEKARAYADYRLAAARKALAEEMIDRAVGMVQERLKEGVTQKDNDRLLEQFVSGLRQEA